MKTTKIPNTQAFPITGTKPTSTAWASKPPGPSNRLKLALAAAIPRLLLLLALALPMAAQAQFQYSVANGEATITGYTGSGGSVVIPATLGGYPVAHIGDNAFLGWIDPNLTSIVIPSSVTSIGINAFYGQFYLSSVTINGTGLITIGDSAFFNDGLVSINIPNSVTSIGDSAFSLCPSLANVNIGTGVTSIGAGAFSDCASLTSILVNAGNSNYSTRDGVLFNNSQTTLLQYPAGKPGSDYTIPDGVTYITGGAFQ